MIKLPKKVTVSGVLYTIHADPKHSGGITDLKEKTIIIGTEIPTMVEEILFHEIFEAILHERGNRFTLYEEGNDKIKFVLDHSEFENVCKDLLFSLKDIKKIK